MRMERFYFYKKNKMKFDVPIDTERLRRWEVRRKYSEQLRKEFEEIKEKECKNDQEKCNDAVKTIVGCGKGILVTKRKVNNNHGRNYDDHIEELSKEQTKLRLIISCSNCAYQIQALKHQRNVLTKEIRKRVNVSREKEIEEAVKGMERSQEESKIFEAAKMLNRIRFEDPFVHDRNGKHVSNPEEVYKIIEDHFKCHFYEKNIESLPRFTGQQESLDKLITTEVRQATLKLNKNSSARLDRISTESVKLVKLVDWTWPDVVETESFQRNKGSSQGDSTNGTFFNKYLEDSLRRARCDFNL